MDRRAEWQVQLGPSRGLFTLSPTRRDIEDDAPENDAGASVTLEEPLTVPQLETLMRAVHASGALLLHGALSGPDVLRSVTLALKRYASTRHRQSQTKCIANRSGACSRVLRMFLFQPTPPQSQHGSHRVASPRCCARVSRFTVVVGTWESV